MQKASRIRGSLLLQLGLAMFAAFLILHIAIAVEYRGPLKFLALLVAWLGVHLAIGFGLNRTPEAKLRSFVGGCILGVVTMIATIALSGYAD